jgi:hypothetical protein
MFGGSGNVQSPRPEPGAQFGGASIKNPPEIRRMLFEGSPKIVFAEA